MIAVDGGLRRAGGPPSGIGAGFGKVAPFFPGDLPDTNVASVGCCESKEFERESARDGFIFRAEAYHDCQSQTNLQRVNITGQRTGRAFKGPLSIGGFGGCHMLAICERCGFASSTSTFVDDRTCVDSARIA